MAVERAPGRTSLIDVLDRILDKGIVIDAWVRISQVGIDLITGEVRVVIASIDTYLKYADAVGVTGTVAPTGARRGRRHRQCPNDVFSSRCSAIGDRSGSEC
jgi:gas vesicle structural protein